MSASKDRPHNPDPEKYIIVHSREGYFLRKKRGTVKKAVVNESFRRQADNNCSAEAKEIFRALGPFTKKIRGRKQVYIAGLLRKAKLENGVPDYRYCEGYEVNRKYPFNKIYHDQVTIKEKKGMLQFEIPVEEDSVVKRNNLVTHFYFEAIMIKGDPRVADSLRSENDQSDLYGYDKEYKTVCKLSLVIPEGMPWMAILKLGCIEFGGPANHPKNYGMKVVRVGGW